MPLESVGLPLASLFGVKIDPVLVGIVVVLLGFFFFIYLFLRRTITGFQEGMQEGSGRNR